MTGVRSLTVAEAEAGLRLDRWFKQHFPDLGHGRLEKLLRTGQIRIDGKRAKSGTRLEAGQSVRVPPLSGSPLAAPAPRRQLKLSAQECRDLQATVLHKDEWLIAIDKPAGLAVQGGTGQSRHLDAMLEALRFEAPEMPRLVHRLDKDTSGVLLLARSAPAARALAQTFKGKEARKIYWAAVAGVPRARQGRIDLPLGKAPGPAGEKVVHRAEHGKEAVTLYQVAGRVAGHRAGTAAWLVLCPLTGRTHQLRAHCAALGHPILGDGKYGGAAAFIERLGESGQRLQLHAREIALPHPEDGTTLRVTAPLPRHMAETWEILGFDAAAGEPAANALEELAQRILTPA